MIQKEEKKKKRPTAAPTKSESTSSIQRPVAKRFLSSGRLAILLPLLVSLAIIPYLNTLSNHFALDDIDIIVKNPLIQNVASIGKMFTTNYWSKGQKNVAEVDPGLYRPLTVFTYAVDYHFWKLDPTGYHLVNLVLHTLTTLAFFFIAMAVLDSPMAAFAAGALFAVHPVHTEAVTGIVGRSEVLAALFFLLAFWFGGPRTAWKLRLNSRARAMVFVAAAVLFYLLGLFSKETAVTLPALLLVYDWIHRREFLNKRNSVQASKLGIVVLRYAGFCIVLLVYLIFRMRAVTGYNVWVGFAGVSTHERIFTASRVLMEYLTLLVFPYTLTADYWKPEVPIAESPMEPFVFLSILLWIVIGVIAFRSARKAPALLFSLGWFFITILPVSNIVFAIGVGKAERILYLPSAGFCLCVGWLYGRLEQRVRKEWVVILPLSIILFTFSFRTYKRNSDWKDNLTLALATLRISPTSPWLNMVAALEYRDRGQPDASIPLLQEAIQERPDYPPYYYELGVTLTQKGLTDQAIQEYRRAIGLKPDYWEAHNNLGTVYFNTNRNDEAIKEFSIALQIDPNNAAAHNNLGSAYLRKGLLDKAIEQYNQAINLKFDYSDPHSNLGAVYINKNQIDDAIKEFSTALRIEPNNAAAYNNLGTAYLRKGLLDKAIEEYKKALSLKPDYPDAQNNLRTVLQQRSQPNRPR